MSERKMTAKGFLHKSNGKISAAAFLTQHRVWLETGDLATFTAPILRKLDDRVEMPSILLNEIKKVVLDHHIATESRKAQEAMSRVETSSTKKFIVTIFNSAGEIQQVLDKHGDQKDLRQGFNEHQDAAGWADRRLFDGAPDWFAVIEESGKLTPNGDIVSQNILRDDAIARILKRPRGSVMKAHKQSTPRLSFGVKVSNDVFKFSRG